MSGRCDRLHEGIKTRQCLERGLGIALEDGANGIRPRCKGMTPVGGSLVLAVAPQSFKGMECGTGGRQKPRPAGGGPRDGVGWVTRALVAHDEIARSRQGGAKAISPALAGGAGAGGALETAAGPRRWFHCPSERDVVALRGAGAHGWHAAGGNPAPEEGQSAEPGCVWGAPCDGAPRRVTGALRGAPRGPGRVPRRHGGGTFVRWAGRGRCGVAVSWYRTSAWTPADATAP
jgi:hypothetical protein